MFTAPTICVVVSLVLLSLCQHFISTSANYDTYCPARCNCHPLAPRIHPVKIEANCSGLALKALPVHFQHIVSLEASFNEIEELPKDFFGKTKLWLSKINLSNNSIRTIDNQAFAVLPELWIFNLTGNKIQYLQHDTFKFNLKLWYLILRGNNIDISGHSIFLNAPKLNKLDLSYNNIRELKETTFSQMPNIVYLRLHNNQFKILRKSWFRPLGKLERLYLEYNQLTHLDVDTFIYTPKLLELSLSWNKLIIPSHTPFLRLPNLEYLHLTGCDFGSLPVHMFEYAPRVRMLWVNSNRLRSLSVAMFKVLESLVFLNACDNHLQCTCDLKEVWEVCRYQKIAAVVSCSFDSLDGGDAGAGTEMETGEEAEAGPGSEEHSCPGRWDVLEEMACNATAASVEAPLEQPGDTSVEQLAVYVTLGVVLLCLLVGGVLFYWKYKTRRVRPVSAARNMAYSDMMPLQDDRDESA